MPIIIAKAIDKKLKIKEKKRGVAEKAVNPLKNSVIGPLLKIGN